MELNKGKNLASMYLLINKLYDMCFYVCLLFVAVQVVDSGFLQLC